MRFTDRRFLLAILIAAWWIPGFAQSSVRYVYDDLGRLVGVIDANGDSATYVYDPVGNLLAIERHSASVVSIISFSPASGPVGATVTITGTAFSTTPGLNTVTFNGTTASVTSATANDLVVTVPAGATTGSIAVTAPAGSATSGKDFTVTIAGAAPTITGFSPSAGLAGTSVTINGTNFETTITNDITRFNATLVTPTSATATSMAALVPSHAGSGHIRLSTPFGTAVSTDDFLIPPSPYVVADVDTWGRIARSTPTEVTVSTASRIALLLFDADGGSRVSLKGTNGISGHIVGCDLNVSIRNPAADVSAPATCMEGSGFINTTSADITGTYSILIDPASTATGSVTLTLYDVPPDDGGSITAGVPAQLSIGTPGQNGAFTFAAGSGEHISVLGNAGTISGQVLGCDVNVTVSRADGSAVSETECMEGSGFIDATEIPLAGTYLITADPVSWATGNLTLTLYNFDDVTSAISSDGTPVVTTMTTPGQNAILTFSGTTGQRISVRGTNGISGQIGLQCDVNVSLLKPDGSTLAGPTCMEGSGFIDTTTLPETGSYTIFVNPSRSATGSLTLALFEVPSDPTATIVPGGAAVTTTITTPGENGTLTFTGSAGERISLQGTNGLHAQVSGCDVKVSILNPDGSTLVDDTCMEGSGFIDATVLPVAGTYTIRIDPASSATGSLTLTLYDLPGDFSSSITAGGSAVTTTTTTPGQNAAVTFSGTAGQRVSLQGTNGMNGQIFFSCDVNVSILNPDASTLASPTCMETSGFIDVKTLPATGTYTVFEDPVGIAVGSLTLTLHDVPADASDTVTVNGATATVSTTIPGQNGQVTFAGTSSQQVTVHVTSNGMGSTTVKLLKPDGTQLTSKTSSASSFTLSTQTLPVTGTYTVTIDPGGANVGSITIGVTNP